MDSWTTYKHRVAARYIPIAPHDVGIRMMQSEQMYLSAKLDGHLAFLHSDGKTCWMTNSGGQRWNDLPLLEDAVAKLNGAVCILAGELHVASASHERTYGFQVPSALANQPDALAFGAFDVLSVEGEDWSASWKETFEKLDSMLSHKGQAFAIPQQSVSSRGQIGPYFEGLVQGGVEGMVIRHEGGPTYKLKASLDLDVVVLGYAEATGEEVGQLREMLVGLAVDESTYQVLGQIGNGLSVENRKKLLERFKHEHAQSDYMEVSGDNVAFTMIPPTTVAQIRCLDVLTENTRGAILRPRLVWTPEGYAYQGMAAAASLMSPVFEGIRSDKIPTPSDAGMGQLQRIVGGLASTSTESKMAKSQLLRREVYVKESKGIQAVRKFLAWKTNKEESGQYPPYVLSFTDYSPTRKDPLKRSLSIANSEERLQAMFDDQVALNVKKGWDKRS